MINFDLLYVTVDLASVFKPFLNQYFSVKNKKRAHGYTFFNTDGK